MKRYLITGITTAIIWQALFSKALTQPPACIFSSLPTVTKTVNTVQQNNVIIIGKVPDRPYVVVVPGDSEQLLNFVRRHIPDAFLAQHRLGTYVYAGSSSRRTDAECISDFLRNQGLDARVVYFH